MSTIVTDPNNIERLSQSVVFTDISENKRDSSLNNPDARKSQTQYMKTEERRESANWGYMNTQINISDSGSSSDDITQDTNLKQGLSIDSQRRQDQDRKRFQSNATSLPFKSKHGSVASQMSFAVQQNTAKLAEKIKIETEKEQKASKLSLVWRQIKRLTLYRIRNGIFMDNEIFFVSRSGQIASAIVFAIVLSFFVTNMLHFNSIVTINVFKDIRTADLDGKYPVTNSKVPTVISWDQEHNLVPNFNQSFPILVILSNNTGPITCDQYIIEAKLAGLVNSSDVVFKINMTCVPNPNFQNLQYYIDDDHQVLIRNHMTANFQKEYRVELLPYFVDKNMANIDFKYQVQVQWQNYIVAQEDKSTDNFLKKVYMRSNNLNLNTKQTKIINGAEVKTNQNGWKSNLYLKSHLISNPPTWWQNIFYLSPDYSMHLKLESILLFPDYVHTSGYIGLYLEEEVIYTKIQFRLLGTILQDAGGFFTVVSGIAFVISFFPIYRDWDNAALKSVNSYSIQNESVDTQTSKEKKKSLMTDLRYRLSYAGLFILHDEVLEYEQQNYELMEENQNLQSNFQKVVNQNLYKQLKDELYIEMEEIKDIQQAQKGEIDTLKQDSKDLKEQILAQMQESEKMNQQLIGKLDKVFQNE